MSNSINTNYSASFQKFVDFANKAYAANAENTVARFSGAPKGDYTGSFASFFRTSEMKAANDQVRDLFLKTVADMFGGEKYIPDIVRDNMKLEDFGKGKPLTARRIQLVKTAIDLLGGGKFVEDAGAAKALSLGYMKSDLPKLARVANIYQQATGCTDAEAEAAALDPRSNARRLFDYGGRFTLNADNFKKGLALMDKFTGWYANLMDDQVAKTRDTLTKLNLNFTVCTEEAQTAVEKFVFEEISVNGKLSLDAVNPEDVFGMAKNPAMQFIGRGYATSLSNSLAQMPPEKRELIYAVFNALDKLPTNPEELARAKHDKVDYGLLVAARVMKNYDAVAALQASRKLDRAHLVPILYPDIEVAPNASNQTIATTYRNRLLQQDPLLMGQIHMVAENSGVSIDEATAAVQSGTRLKNAPGISSFTGELKELDGTAAGGRKTMIADLNRASTPSFTENETQAIADEDANFVFHFPDGETLDAMTGSSSDPQVISANNAIADKIAHLCGNVHPKQLSNVYYALSQSAVGANVNSGFRSLGITSDEHMAVTFTLSRNAETGAVTIKYSEPKGMPVKFNWTTTIDLDGHAVTTPMRIDHGQYETEAMTHADGIAVRMPGKDRASAEALIKDLLAHCGDDFDLKGIVSKHIYDICINAVATMRPLDQIKARIDAIRANLAEIRAAANGNAAAEQAGVVFLENLSGKSVPPGLVGKLVKAAANANPGEYAKLSAASTPKQLFQAVVDMHAAIEKAMNDARVTDSLDGGPELTAARDYIATLILSQFPSAKLQGAVDAFRGETALKLLTLINKIGDGDRPAKVGKLTLDQRSAIATQCYEIGIRFGQYNLAAENVLGKSGGEYSAYAGDIDKNALGHNEIFQALLVLANDQVAAEAEAMRQNQNINVGMDAARANATIAYGKVDQANAGKVDNLIFAALQRCAANADAVKVVSDNINSILVSNTAQLRNVEEVRERAEAIAANFAELQELSKDNPAIYEAGKRLMASMGGKALPPGMIGKLVLAATNAKIDSIRKLSSRSSGLDIHRAVTQLRDNLVQGMSTSGAEMAAGGPDEKQACRNFIATLLVNRCGDKARHAMRSAFEGDKPAKMLSVYSAIADGEFNQGLDVQVTIRLEDQAASHMTHLAILKDAIDLAIDGRPGAGIAPFNGQLDADTVDGSAILDDLVDMASN